jgi:hypothetical protein
LMSSSKSWWKDLPKVTARRSSTTWMLSLTKPFAELPKRLMSDTTTRLFSQ